MRLKKKVLTYLELEQQGRGIIVEGTCLLLLGPFMYLLKSENAISAVQCKSFIVAAFETKSSCLLPCLLALEIWRVVFSSEVGCQYKSNTHPSAEAWFYCYDFVSCTGRKTGFKSFPSCGGSPPHWRGARSAG